MNDPDIHALSGAYAVDAIDDLERVRFETHLDQCAACREEVASLQESAAHLGDATASAPPPALRGRILDEIRTVRPLPPETGTGAGAGAANEVIETAPSPRRTRGWRPLLVAASLAGILGLGAVVVDQVTGDDTTQTVTAADRVLAAADAVSVSAKLPHGASARVVHSASEGKAVLLTSNMPAPPEGKVYELWLQHDDTMVPAGLMEDGSGKVLFEGDPNTAQAAGITIEPAGGSDQPTTAPIALFDFSKAT